MQTSLEFKVNAFLRSRAPSHVVAVRTESDQFGPKHCAAGESHFAVTGGRGVLGAPLE